MYSLTTSISGKMLPSGTPVTASQALRNWFSEETTGYDVICSDQRATRVTCAQLRAVARHA